MLTIKEVAEQLTVHPNTIRNWIKEGRIEVIRLSNRTHRIEQSQIDKLRGHNGKEHID